MDVYWLEQADADVPAENGWLNPAELLRLEALRVPKRRADWRLGRWTAKSAVAACLDGSYPLAAIEIRAAASGAPEVFVANQAAPVAISLSHRVGVACCAVARDALALGCDLELVESHSDAFVAGYFTAEEREMVARVSPGGRCELLTLLWSAKESALKALRVGLRCDTRSVVVQDPVVGDWSPSGGDAWCPLRVEHAGGEFHGWWRLAANLVRTMLAAPQPRPPKVLSGGRAADRRLQGSRK